VDGLSDVKISSRSTPAKIRVGNKEGYVNKAGEVFMEP
jgi:hypothetical protein